mgnify:CR=1 FL=1
MWSVAAVTMVKLCSSSNIDPSPSACLYATSPMNRMRQTTSTVRKKYQQTDQDLQVSCLVRKGYEWRVWMEAGEVITQPNFAIARNIPVFYYLISLKEKVFLVIWLGRMSPSFYFSSLRLRISSGGKPPNVRWINSPCPLVQERDSWWTPREGRCESPGR